MEEPRKHLSEVVEDAMEDEGKKAHLLPPPQGPTIKIVINTGMGSPSHGPRPKKKPHKPKKPHNPGVPGPMEDALSAAY